MSLVLVGPSKWPESMKFLPSQRQASQGNSETISDGTTPSYYRHARKLSRPFDVLYQDDLRNIKPPKLEGDLNTQYMNMTTPSYIEIENTLRSGALPNTHQAVGQAPPPTVTVIEEKGTNRSSSINSRLANLRRRHSKRNWMARRRDIYPDGEKKSPEQSLDTKKASRIDFIFPIRRKTSFRYSRFSSTKSLRFKSQKDIDNYFALDSVATAMRSLLPQTMYTFEFEKLKRIEPILKSVPHFFDVPRPNFAFATSNNREPLNQVPLVAHNSTLNTVSSPIHSDPLFLDQKKALLSLYSKYRELALGARVKFPPKIEILLPLESEQVLEDEREAFNRDFLFEVLLRRTLAAKIDFRLKQSMRLYQGSTPKLDSSSSSSQLDLSSIRKTPKSPQKLSHHQKSSDNEDSDNGDDKPSKGTSGVERESPSLSELLPSPQITASSTQNFQFTAPEPMGNESHGEDAGDNFKEPPTKANSASLNLASANTTLEAHKTTPHTTLTSPMNAETSLSGSSIEGVSKMIEILEPEVLSPQKEEPSLNLETANLSLLKPHNFSSESLSSSSTVSGNNCFEIYNCDYTESEEKKASSSEQEKDPEELAPSADKGYFEGDRSREIALPDKSSVQFNSPDVSEGYFYPKFMRLFAPDAVSKSKLPSEAAVLERQRSMGDARSTTKFRDHTVSDTRRSESSELERKTIT